MRVTPTTPFSRSTTPTAPATPATADAPVVVPTWRDKLGGYISLTKPRIIELLLITTVPTMFLAADGWPSGWLVLATLGGGALAAASANVVNCIIDRDIDAVMNRTRKRPLVTGTISPTSAWVFAVLLGIGSMLLLGLAVNWLSAALAFAALVIYIGLYTLLLKRRTSQNIVWGGLAGCMPVLIGWAAVRGQLDWPPVALFLVVFFWTPPHYWPLSMKFKREYEKAGVPMLPVVASERRVAREMLGYAAAMVASSLVLVPLAPMTWIYAVGAAAIGAWFLALCIGLYRRSVDPARPKLREMTVFHGSITYLTALSLLVTIDPFWPV